MPTHRWKQVPVSCPSLRCIWFCATTSSSAAVTWRNRLTRSPVSGEVGGQLGLAHRQIVRGGDGVDRRPDDRVVDRLGHPLAEQPHLEAATRRLSM